MDKQHIKDQMRRRWDQYFAERLGFDAESAKNVPCFVCGGDDRFSWTNLHGDGGYYCRGGGDAHYTDGIGMAQELWKHTQGYDLSFRETLNEIGNWLQDKPVQSGGYAKATAKANPEAQDRTKQALSRQDASNSAVSLHDYVRGKDLSSSVVFRSRDTGIGTGKDGELVINVPYSAYDDPDGPRIGVEQIYPDGRKLTLAGTHKGVNLLSFNSCNTNPDWLVVEGWATGLALCMVLRNSNEGRYRVAVSGGKGKLDKTCAELPNARPIYEDDGNGVPAGELHFIKTPNGNDIADHLQAGDDEAIQHFIRQL